MRFVLAALTGFAVQAYEKRVSEETSFLESTLKGIKKEREDVMRINSDLDQQEEKMIGGPFSLLQLSNPEPTPDDFDDAFPYQQRKAGPMSALEAAKARAAESEKRFQAALQRLEADKQSLLQDQSMRRAKASQERRHLHI